MPRLPQPGADEGTWGEVLNNFLMQAHTTNGSLKDDAVTAAAIADAAIDEVKLSNAVRSKLNAASGDPAVGGDLSGTTSNAQIVANAVGTTELADNSVSTPKLQDDATTEAKLAPAVRTKLNTPPSSTPADGSLTPAKLSSDTPATGELLSYNGSGFEWITAPDAGGGGEVNTASNVGSTGVGVYKQKTGANLELKNIAAASNKVTVTNNPTNNTVDLEVNEANFSLTKAQVGLANVDNTSDTNKPISSATQTALDAKATDSTVVHDTGNETVAGVKTFSSSPIVPTPTTGTQAANKTYVDSVAGAGAPDATTTTKGIVQLAGDLGGTAAAPTVPGLAGKANTSHTHSQSDVSGLSAALVAKLDASQKGAANGVASLDGTGKVPTAQLPATSAPVASVAGKTGDVTLIKADVGLANVDNTTDAAKPISTATATALAGKAPTTHSHAIADLPAGSVVSTSSSTRPTARTDIVVMWTGSTDPGASALNGDVWLGAA